MNNTSRSAVRLNYVEFGSTDLTASKTFFNRVFGWTFTDYGNQYSAFSAVDAGLNGGFYAADTVTGSGPLLVFYAPDLETTRQLVVQGGAELSRDIFSFPGGRRFHFREPGGNELAVWSEPLPES